MSGPNSPDLEDLLANIRKESFETSSMSAGYDSEDFGSVRLLETSNVEGVN
jgi:hypothetical protein